MTEPLDSVAVRILGSLVEKESTTPDNYPLTLNSLVSACNQTSNREPVMEVDEAMVLRSLDDLMQRTLVRELYRSDSRAKRFRHALSDTMHLHTAEIAALGVLMLRGPQTAGEIRTRTARLYEFRDIPHVEVTLQSMATLTTPLVMQMARRPGQKEARFAHLLAGKPVDNQPDATHVTHDAASEPVPARVDRIQALENTVEALRDEMAELRARFEEFSRQFQ